MRASRRPGSPADGGPSRELTAFVGRPAELAALTWVMRTARPVTGAGAGETGKSCRTTPPGRPATRCSLSSPAAGSCRCWTGSGDPAEAAVLRGAAGRAWPPVGPPLFGSACCNAPHEAVRGDGPGPRGPEQREPAASPAREGGETAG
ncbi:hypothetical protein [Streptomyces bungoensis]|uniref:hypothetical protein n=1 Tax=Streptomyces bungoensis TaxID=285568 RepID=UPI003F4CD3BC